MTKNKVRKLAGREDTEEEILKWDEHYNDPKAEIVLVSKDNVGFRMSAWYMKRASKYIADMLLAVPSRRSTATSVTTLPFPLPLHLDTSSTTLRIYITVVSTPNPTPATYPELTYAQTVEMLSLCDRLLSPVLRAGFTDLMFIKCKSIRGALPAWEVFEIASQIDDLPLAKDAIKRFGWEAALDKFPNLPVSAYARVAPKYAIALLACAFEPQGEDQPKFGGRVMRSWYAIANTFNPKA